MTFTAAQIAAVVQGKIIGNPDTTVRTFAKIEEASEHAICFLANEKYSSHLATTKASIVLISESLVKGDISHSTLIVVPDAYASFATLMQTYMDIVGSPKKDFIEAMSYVSEKSQLGTGVYIGAFSYISEHASVGDGSQVYPGVYVGTHVRIGKNCIIYAGVKIYDHCVIGDDVIIHAGTVIGSDGFGFAPENGYFKKIPQIGNVVIESRVEIGANCTIDRATMGSTVIGKGSKLDNLIQVAHNVELGQHNVIASQAGISGSTKIGNYCQIGGQAGIVGHIRIADFARINAQSGVAKDIKTPHSSLTGSPAYDYRSSLRSQVVYRQLPEWQQKITALEHKLELLTKQLNTISNP